MSNWLSEMMDNFDDAFGEDYLSENLSLFPTFNPSPLELEASQACFERPTKQLKSTDSRNSCTTEQVSFPEGSSPDMFSFGNSSSPTSHRQPMEEVRSPANKKFVSDRWISQGDCINQNYAPKAGQGNKRAAAQSTKPATATATTYPQDHVVAERKRREKLSQGFIALSAIVPGLKKMDKTSVLETSIRYIRELQEKAKTYEDQTAKKTMESVVFVKKFQISSGDDDSSSDETSTNSSTELLPEIETRVSDENVLIRIHCEKRKGVMVKALEEIEKLNLSVVSSSSILFGTSTMDITVLAEKGIGFNMEAKDLGKSLRSSFHQFM